MAVGIAAAAHSLEDATHTHGEVAPVGASSGASSVSAIPPSHFSPLVKSLDCDRAQAEASLAGATH